jgi:hypothetical protein
MKYKKGKGYFGKVGVGKTYTMRQQYESKEPSGLKRWYTAIELAALAQQHGLEALLEKVKCTHLYIDDIGRERVTVSSYGTTINVIENLIAARYDYVRHNTEWLPNVPNPDRNGPAYIKDGYYTTTFTTNLSIEEMNRTYGEYIVDRLIEMCELELMQGDSKRQ